MVRLLALAGALPALIAMFIIDRADAKRPEPRSTLRRVAIMGALSTIPAVVIELFLLRLGPPPGLLMALYTAFVVAALVEEAVKGLVVRWFVWNRLEFDERTDGIVYGARAGLGFALLENVGYLLGAKTMSTFIVIFVLRAVMTVPIHAIAGGLMGHYAAWRRFEGRGPGLLGGYLLAVLVHGAFDTCMLSLPMFIQAKDVGIAVVAFVAALVIVVVGLIALRRAWRRALDADDAASLRASVIADAA